MMNKRMIVGAFGLMAIATTALAQPWGGYGPGTGGPGTGGPGMGGPGMGGPGGNVDFRIERMTAMLDLSPQQQEQLRAIFQEQQGRRQAMQQAMQQVMRSQVDAILTPEQREKHAQMMGSGGRGFGGGRGWGGGPGMGPCPLGWGPGAGGPPGSPPPVRGPIN